MKTLRRTPQMGLLAGTILVAALTILLCLIPKPENDLFFELRIGTDILNTGRVPHADTYSWINRGTRWDVPEWGAFVLYALAFRAGGFFGTWLLMAGLAVATAWMIWFWLAARAGLLWAFGVTNLTLLAMRDVLQERPYAFTYLALAVSLILVLRAREGRARRLLWLPPLCALWANLHQGVLVLVCLLFVFAGGEAVSAVWRRARAVPPDLLTVQGRAASAQGEEWRPQARQAWLLLGTAIACAAASCVSPYGWRIGWNVFVTLRDPVLMANVTEWKPAWTLPPAQWEPFGLAALLAFGALAFSPRRRLADFLVLLALGLEALLHARNMALFALAGAILAAPHAAACAAELRRIYGLPARSRPRSLVLAAIALVYVAAVADVSLSSLRRAMGLNALCAASVGAAVAQTSDYPADACAFMDSEGFPSRLRLLNDFEAGGFLLWRLPREPVFIDGRLDVYAGRTFDDMVTLARTPGSPAWAGLVRRYDFDCVLTRSARQAQAFGADPGWQLVYASPDRDREKRSYLLLRRRPVFAGLIARCLRDRQASRIPAAYRVY